MRVFAGDSDFRSFRGSGGGRCRLGIWADACAASGQNRRGVWTVDSLLGCRFRAGGGAGPRTGKPKGRLDASAGTAGAEVTDQIGFGKSEKPLLDYSVQTYVDFLNEFLRQLKVEKTSLVGESLGGWISALYSAELGEGGHLIPIEKLVLVAAAGLKQDAPIPNMNPSSLATMRGVMESVFSDTSWLNEDALRKIFTDKLSVHDSYTVRSFLGNPMIASERLDERLGKIKTPTLVVWGKQDKLLPLAMGERYAAGIAGAKLVSFDKCGHVPPIEKTEEFLAAVTAFLGGGTAH